MGSWIDSESTCRVSGAMDSFSALTVAVYVTHLSNSSNYMLNLGEHLLTNYTLITAILEDKDNHS